MSHAETVQAIYEPSGVGDVETILDNLDDNVEWENDRARAGRTVAASTPRQSGDKVFVLITFEATARGKDARRTGTTRGQRPGTWAAVGQERLDGQD